MANISDMVPEESSIDVLDLQKDDQVILGQINPETLLKNDKTKAILLWAYHGNSGFFGKDNTAGSKRRGKSNMR